MNRRFTDEMLALLFRSRVRRLRRGRKLAPGADLGGDPVPRRVSDREFFAAYPEAPRLKRIQVM